MIAPGEGVRAPEQGTRTLVSVGALQRLRLFICGRLG